MLIAQRPLEGLLGGLWEFPGGKQEAGETLPDCLRRELREELAIEVEVGELFMQVNTPSPTSKSRCTLSPAAMSAANRKLLACESGHG